MRVDQFDFDLPEDRIALHPAEPRDSARLLVVGPDGGLEDRVVTDLFEILQPGDVLVVNDTRVIPAELAGTRVRGDSMQSRAPRQTLRARHSTPYPFFTNLTPGSPSKSASCVHTVAR